MRLIVNKGGMTLTLPDMIGLDGRVAFFSNCSGNTYLPVGICNKRGLIRSHASQVPFPPHPCFHSSSPVVHTDKHFYFLSGSSSSHTVRSIQWERCKTEATIFIREKQERVNICGCQGKGSTRSLITFRPWVLVWLGVRPALRLRRLMVLYQVSYLLVGSGYYKIKVRRDMPLKYLRFFVKQRLTLWKKMENRL